MKRDNEQRNEDLQALVKRHMASCDWQEGQPVEWFQQDGCPCVRYESGAWWHYDLKRRTWF